MLGFKSIIKWTGAFFLSALLVGGILWFFIFWNSGEDLSQNGEKPVGPKSSTATEFITKPIVLGKLGIHYLEISNEDLKIRLYKADNLKNAIQVFGPVNSDEDFKNPDYVKNPHELFNEEDLNFDGYPDLKIPQIKSAKETWFTVFVFDPQKKKYFKDLDLSQLCNVQADKEKKEIISRTSGRVTDEIYVKKYFKWKPEGLRLIRLDQQDIVEENRLKRDLLVNMPDNTLDTLASIIINTKNIPHVWCLRKGKWKYAEKFFEDIGLVIKKESFNEPCFVPDGVLQAK